MFVVVRIDINGQYLAGKFVKLQVNSMIVIGTAVVSGKSLSLNGISHQFVNIASTIAEFDSFNADVAACDFGDLGDVLFAEILHHLWLFGGNRSGRGDISAGRGGLRCLGATV